MSGLDENSAKDMRSKGLIHGFIRCRDESAPAALEFKQLTRSLSLFMNLGNS